MIDGVTAAAPLAAVTPCPCSSTTPIPGGTMSDEKPTTPEQTPTEQATAGQAPEQTTAEDAKPKPASRGGRKAATIAPKAYGDDDAWPLGGSAPHDVVRVYDPETSELGPARKGPSKPGERAVIVAAKGDIITRSVLANLGR